jgi:proteasome lid subunit RPN8/RPN11
MGPDNVVPPASLTMTRPQFNQMIAHVQAVFPLEGCGLLAGSGDTIAQIYPVRNRLQSATEFEMDPEQQLRSMLDLEAQGWELLAIFHSHPQGPQTPSPTDVARAYYPESAQLIVSLKNPVAPVTRAFTIVAGQINEIPLIIE